MTAQDRVVDLPPPVVLGLLAGGRLAARRPTCGRSRSGSRRSMMPVSTHRTSPSAQRALGAQQRAGDVAVHGPRQVGLVVGHHLPDRVEHVGLGAELEDPVQERRGEVGLAGARARAAAWTSAMACSVIHSAWRRQASSSGVLISRAALITSLAAARRPVGEQQVAVAVHRARSPRRRRPSRVGGDQIGERVGEAARRPRRGRGRSGRAGGRRRGRARRAASARNGVNRCGISSSASTTATGRSTLARPASLSGQIAPVA